MSRSPINQLIRDLRMSAARAKHTPGSRYDDRTVTITIPAHIALMVARRLETAEDRTLATRKLQSEMREASDIAEDAMRDTALRFSYAVTDLELLLMEFIGRPAMTMQEVREQRQITEARPSPGPQPFIRKKPPVAVSHELKKSIRSGKIGDPREPGQDD